MSFFGNRDERFGFILLIALIAVGMYLNFAKDSTHKPVGHKVPTKHVVINHADAKAKVIASKINCVFPAHLYEGGTVYVHCETPGFLTGVKSLSRDTRKLVKNTGKDVNTYTKVKMVYRDMRRWDGSSCPTHLKCYGILIKGVHPTPKKLDDVMLFSARFYDKVSTVSGSFAILEDCFDRCSGNSGAPIGHGSKTLWHSN